MSTFLIASRRFIVNSCTSSLCRRQLPTLFSFRTAFHLSPVGLSSLGFCTAVPPGRVLAVPSYLTSPPLVGRTAPSIEGADVVTASNEFDTFNLSSYLNEKYVLLVFYPLDFTFVCPSELLAFNERLAEFHQRDVEVVGVSVDSKFSHLAWKQLSVMDGGVGSLGFPLVSDLGKTISRDYGLLLGGPLVEDGDPAAAASSVSLRGLFLIDKKGTVQHMVVNNLPLGRSVGEALRMVDALRFTETRGELCPANWTEGKEGMKASHEGMKSYLGKHHSLK